MLSISSTYFQTYFLFMFYLAVTQAFLLFGTCAYPADESNSKPCLSPVSPRCSIVLDAHHEPLSYMEHTEHNEFYPHMDGIRAPASQQAGEYGESA
eukprot:884114-Pelagomonas_calceolata.AAC.2